MSVSILCKLWLSRRHLKLPHQSPERTAVIVIQKSILATFCVLIPKFHYHGNRDQTVIDAVLD